MGMEIERKFLVDRAIFESIKANCAFKDMRQGYLSSGSNATVRVRVAGDEAFFTIKGRIVGFSRSEFEYPVPVADAEIMLKTLCHGVVTKRRYYVQVEQHLWEVDDFSGDNEGLITAEIELTSEAEEFTIPEFAIKELTGMRRYYNGSLAVMPYKKWPKE